MRYALFFLILLLFTAVAQADDDATNPPAGDVSQSVCGVVADDHALHQIAELWKDGYNHGNAAQVAALYSQDATYLTQHFITGMLHGRANIQAYVQRGIDAGYHIDSIQILATGCSGNLAYTVGRYEATNGGQKAMGVNLVVARRVKGKWLIIAHEAAVPDPATAIQHLDTPNQPPH
jgi:ketosteroid isomerase-like protein